jgi:hypothetical protein
MHLGFAAILLAIVLIGGLSMLDLNSKGTVTETA